MANESIKNRKSVIIEDEIGVPEAVKFLQKELAAYDTSFVRHCTLGTTRRKAGWLVSVPIAQPRNIGAKVNPASDFPQISSLPVGTHPENNARGWDYDYADVTFQSLDEIAIAAMSSCFFFFLKRSKQGKHLPGRCGWPGADNYAIAQLEAFRNRTLPGMGRRAAIMAQRAAKRQMQNLRPEAFQIWQHVSEEAPSH